MRIGLGVRSIGDPESADLIRHPPRFRRDGHESEGRPERLLRYGSAPQRETPRTRAKKMPVPQELKPFFTGLVDKSKRLEIHWEAGARPDAFRVRDVSNG